MRQSLITPAAVATIAVCGLISCGPDSVSSPERDLAPLTNQQGTKVLTVDDDGTECRRADFTTIQEAVTAADEGTTILVCEGTYEEQVLITKNDLRLLATGKPGAVVLDGLDLHDMVAGFLLENAHDNLIQGFLVRNYHEAGIWLTAGSSRNRIRRNVTTSSSFHDGIQVANSPENVIEHNTSFDNFSPNNIACGINIIGAGSDRNVVRNNETFGNDFGIQVVAGANDNVVFGNVSHDNRRFGIRTIGATGTLIENNRAHDNTGPGFAVISSTGVKVQRNQAFGNDPDIFWDQVGANTFTNNHCDTSVPAGLCK